MRDILFRGKCFHTEEWVEGYLGIEVPDELVIQQFSYDKYFESDCIDQYSVKPETLGQFTGLTDKNGVRVFEGDIVRIFDGEYCSVVIKYSNEQGSFTVDDTSLHYWVSDIEVIGNVHDNPELLNK